MLYNTKEIAEKIQVKETRTRQTIVKAVIFDMFETLITHFDSPLYFGKQIAADIGIEESSFRELWDDECMETDRSTGKITLEEELELILRKNGCYSEKMLTHIVQKRIAVKEECLNHLHPEIIPLFVQLKQKGIKIGLISNCYSEEVPIIKNSVLFPYFDAAFLSYEQGVQKPDKEIFYRCINKLMVHADECLYIGDGGSRELETAQELGMKAIQAVWYLKEEVSHSFCRKKEFVQAENPLDIVEYVE